MKLSGARVRELRLQGRGVLGERIWPKLRPLISNSGMEYKRLSSDTPPHLFPQPFLKDRLPTPPQSPVEDL